MSYLRATIDLMNTAGKAVSLRPAATAAELRDVETYLTESADPDAIAVARALGASQSIQAAGPRACQMYIEGWRRNKNKRKRSDELAAEVARALRSEFQADAMREAASMDAGALTNHLDALLGSICDLYSALAAKRVTDAAGQSEALAVVSKMLAEHITHLGGVEDKYTGGAQDSQLRQAA